MDHLIKVTLFLSLARSILGYQWPSPRYDALEELLYEGGAINQINVAEITRDCRKDPGSATNASTVAARWLRFAYHDAATHNITDGTGGLDASIFFELDRNENIGASMNSTVLDFELSSSKYISRADLVALGAVFAVAACKGPIIPFRGGRIDALSAGRLGVPKPDQNLTSHTENFRLQGFNATDMISLVACGHTLGAVKSVDFPEVVTQINASTPNFRTFDSTDPFDSAVVSEYLNGTTTNPLIIARNQTFASDRRIFESDRNVTMQSMNNPTSFAQTCSKVLERMLNTVPTTVNLTEVIELLPAKVSNARITIENGALVFKTLLRLAQPTNATVPAGRTVRMFWCDRRGGGKDCGNGVVNVASSASTNEARTSPVAQSLGFSFPTYNFVVPIESGRSVSTFWFEVDEHDGSHPTIYDNGGNGRYSVPQDEIIYVPSLSSSTERGVDIDKGRRVLTNYTILAGIRTEKQPSRAFLSAFNNAERNQPPPFNVTLELQPNSTVGNLHNYTFYSVSVESSGLQVTIDLSVVMDGITYTEDYLQTTVLGQLVSIQAPTSVGTTSMSSVDAPGSSQKSGEGATYTRPTLRIWSLGIGVSLLYVGLSFV